MALSREELIARRRLDLEVLAETFAPHEGLVSDLALYASSSGAERKRAAAGPEHARVYELTLRATTLVGPGAVADRWRIRIDAASADYPFEPPTATVLDRVRPWLPHVNPHTGWICGGNAWSPTKLIAHLVVDILRIFNFDEDPQELMRTTGHFNARSMDYWLEVLGGKPLFPVRYPEVKEPLAAVAFGSPFGVMP